MRHSCAVVERPFRIKPLRGGAKVREHREDAAVPIDAAHVELAEDRAHVRLDGSLRQPELLRDPRVRAALRHQPEHLALARRQLVERVVAGLGDEELLDDLRVERAAAAAHTRCRLEELVDVQDAVLQEVAEAAARADELDRVVRLDVLREHEDGRLRVPLPDLGGRAHALVLVRRRHAYVDDREIRLVLGDDGHERLGVSDAGDDRVTGILEQPRDPLAEEHGVVGDHDSHGSATSTRVPRPRGLETASVPPWAATRSCRPARPEPRRTTAPPMPSSLIETRSVPFCRTARMDTRDADAYRTAFVSASHATKYAAASTLAWTRSTGTSTSTGIGALRARSASAAERPSSSRAGRTPAAICRRSPIAPPISSTTLSRAGDSTAAPRGSPRCSRRTWTPRETSRCCAPSWRSRSSRRRSS